KKLRKINLHIAFPYFSTEPNTIWNQSGLRMVKCLDQKLLRHIQEMQNEKYYLLDMDIVKACLELHDVQYAIARVCGGETFVYENIFCSIAM
ncbi:hypothetical protein BgiMline_006632, partial [Biomphalaria glabrata]